MLSDKLLDQFLDDFLVGKKESVTIEKKNYVRPEAEDIWDTEEEYDEAFQDMPAAPPAHHRLSKRTWAAIFMIVIMIPLTIWFGIQFMGDRKYYFISMMIIIYTIVPFVMVFEGRKPQARELVILAVLSAIAVAGRAAFFMLPQFKPVVAVVIITGVCFGAESGFLVGAVTGFVSNFFFGQGPWTPWQMFAFGIIGFLAGVLFRKGILRSTKPPLCIYGFLSTFFIYGIIMDTASVFMVQPSLSWKVLLPFYISGTPFNLIHAGATVFFLVVASKPMIEKLERIKKKYGLIQR